MRHNVLRANRIWLVLGLWLALVPAMAWAEAESGHQYDASKTITLNTDPPVKRIEVILSQQRLIAWEDDRRVFEFPVTTGQEGQPTLTGEYEILDKIEDAYSEAWLLKLPLWMGIYQVGEWENGFHALPLDDDGIEYWREAVGHYPASHGCIVLLPEDAETLFNWAEVGTKVVIIE